MLTGIKKKTGRRPRASVFDGRAAELLAELDLEDESEPDHKVKKTPTFAKKKYYCNVCDFNHAKRSGLRLHLLQYHLGKPIQYECLICSAHFIKSSGIRRHLSNVHKIKNLTKQDLHFRDNWYM